MKEFAKKLFGSRKFCSLLVGMGAMILVRKLGFEEAEATEISREIMVLISTYMLGQGIADFGKEKAKAGAPTVSVTSGPTVG